MLSGMIKGFNFSLHFVLYELSYANLILLSATLPSYDKQDKNKDEEIIDTSAPENREKIKAFFDAIE